MSSSSKPSKKRCRRCFSARQKCEAVLSLWTESSSQSEICKELKVSSLTLQRWQEQAMTAMLKALEPKRKKPEGGSPLSPRLEKLLSRQLPKPPPKADSSPSSPQDKN